MIFFSSQSHPKKVHNAHIKHGGASDGIEDHGLKKRILTVSWVTQAMYIFRREWTNSVLGVTTEIVTSGAGICIIQSVHYQSNKGRGHKTEQTVSSRFLMVHFGTTVL